jgi:hypothetical protein
MENFLPSVNSLSLIAYQNIRSLLRIVDKGYQANYLASTYEKKKNGKSSIQPLQHLHPKTENNSFMLK